MICQTDLSFSVEKKNSGVNQFPPQNMNFDPAYKSFRNKSNQICNEQSFVVKTLLISVFANEFSIVTCNMPCGDMDACIGQVFD